ncbi:MAG: alcohol dehydrogenase catalytic domain-containing protein [Proteobacteria bacterium]|nr:alcohol dehydrogenase catalytic domain-containing protein [Burkholderiales bacterium]
MKAMMLRAGGDMRYETVPDPVLADNQVVVKVHACSICGSDLHAFHGKHPRLTFPRILGHEFAGEVVEVGRGVKTVRVGARVCCDVDLACGECGPCKAGRGNICERLRTMGFDTDGAYAEYAAVPDFNLYPLPDNVTYDQASAVQVLGISYHAVADRVKPQAGDRIAVIGAGPIGLGAALIAQSLGAEVTILDLLDYRLALAQRLGVAGTMNARELRASEWARSVTGGQGFDKVIECVGGLQERTIADAIGMVKRGGQITIVGTFPENKATVPIAFLKDREIDINFSRGNFRAFAPCLDLVATGKIDPDAYISHRFPLRRAEDALKLLQARDVEAHKIVLHPQEL